MKITKRNRKAKLSPKRACVWCIGCDRAKVPVGQKCPICGTREITTHKK